MSSLCTGPRPVGSTKTLRWDNISPKVCSEVSIINISSDNGKYSTLIGEKLSMRTPWNRRLVSLTPNGGSNKHFATSKSDERGGEKHLKAN